MYVGGGRSNTCQFCELFLPFLTPINILNQSFEASQEPSRLVFRPLDRKILRDRDVDGPQLASEIA